MQYIEEMTKKEFNDIPIQYVEEKWFNGFVVVPMKTKHVSGWQNMKYVLLQDGEIVGCIGGGSDVIRLYNYNWSIDCLPKSKLLRFFNSRRFKISDVSCLSTFIIPINGGLI